MSKTKRVYRVRGKELPAITDLPALGIPAPPKIKVLVIVRGGLVESVRASHPAIEAEVLDWDNVKDGDTFHDLEYAEGKVIVSLVQSRWPHEVM